MAHLAVRGLRQQIDENHHVVEHADHGPVQAVQALEAAAAQYRELRAAVEVHEHTAHEQVEEADRLQEEGPAARGQARRPGWPSTGAARAASAAAFFSFAEAAPTAARDSALPSCVWSHAPSVDEDDDAQLAPVPRPRSSFFIPLRLTAGATAWGGRAASQRRSTP
mgnify:CR=1 FL=1